MEDFMTLLVAHINELELALPVKIGLFDEEDSLLVKPVEGSEVIHTYMNGSLDVRLPFEVGIKSKNQAEAYKTLHQVMAHVKKLGNHLKEKDEAHLLLQLDMDLQPVFKEKTANAFIYSAKLIADIAVAG